MDEVEQLCAVKVTDSPSYMAKFITSVMRRMQEPATDEVKQSCGAKVTDHPMIGEFGS